MFFEWDFLEILKKKIVIDIHNNWKMTIQYLFTEEYSILPNNYVKDVHFVVCQIFK